VKTKKEFVTWFRANEMPAIRKREGERPDNSLRAEVWNNLTDMLVRSGELSESALTWSNPFDLRRDSPTVGEKRKRRKVEVEKTPIRDNFVRRVVLAAVNVPMVEARKLALRLRSMATESKCLAENACNRELTPSENARDDELDAKVKAIGLQLGLRAFRQGDPRGHTIRVLVGRDLADNWDGETTGCG
jgi:hypothetical protein